ncbi:MAG: helix-turn-helix transcriptional regulator [Terrimicrobiaceae bacterium]
MLKKAEMLSLCGGKLRQWRKSKAKKITEAAGEMGVATASWGHWETGHCLPSVANLLLLAQYTGIPLQHFLCPNSDRCPFAGNS